MMHARLITLELLCWGRDSVRLNPPSIIAVVWE
jgi:hypothetical protein